MIRLETRGKHTSNGSLTRFNKPTGTIEPDTLWESQLTSAEKWSLFFLGEPVNRALGYPAR